MALPLYSDEQKLDCVRAFVTHGGYRQAGVATGIPWETIYGWGHRDPQWWDREVAKFSLELLGTLTEASQHKALCLRERALELIADRMEHGESKMCVKTGTVVKVPVGIADLTKTFTALGGQKAPPKVEAPKTEEDRLLELQKVAEEDRAGRPN